MMSGVGDGRGRWSNSAIVKSCCGVLRFCLRVYIQKPRPISKTTIAPAAALPPAKGAILWLDVVEFGGFVGPDTGLLLELELELDVEVEVELVIDEEENGVVVVDDE
jgi:hypothetical protein